MKKVWDKIASPSTMRYLAYLVVLFVLFHLGKIFSSQMDNSLLYQHISYSFSAEEEVSFVKIGSTEDGSVLLRVETKSGQVLSYVHPFRLFMGEQVVEGWDMFDKNLQYQDYHVVYWENHKELRNLVNKKEVRDEIVEKKTTLSTEGGLYSPLLISSIEKKNPQMFQRISSFVENRLSIAFGIPEEFSSYLFEIGEK